MNQDEIKEYNEDVKNLVASILAAIHLELKNIYPRREYMKYVVSSALEKVFEKITYD